MPEISFNRMINLSNFQSIGLCERKLIAHWLAIQRLKISYIYILYIYSMLFA